MTDLAPNTIYERLGGKPAVKAAVEIFYRRILVDPELAPFFTHTPLEQLKRHQFVFLSQALDGPKQYSGAAVDEVHAGVAIKQRHFDAVAGHLVETLRELNVNEGLIGEVIARIAPLSAQVVNTPN
jgi:hemoglobin